MVRDALKKRKRETVGGLAGDDEARARLLSMNGEVGQRREHVPQISANRTVKVSRAQLAHAMKSKLDIYNVLAIEGQMHLPPYEQCSMEFFRQIFKGEKKVSTVDPRPCRPWLLLTVPLLGRRSATSRSGRW